MRTENTSQSYFIPKVRDLTVNVTKTPRTRISLNRRAHYLVIVGNDDGRIVQLNALVAKATTFLVSNLRIATICARIAC